MNLLRFLSGKYFYFHQDISKINETPDSYILFFNNDSLRKYFNILRNIDINNTELIYAQPNDYGIENFTKRMGNYFVIFCSKSLIDFLNSLNILENKIEKYEYLILSEFLDKPKEEDYIINIEKDFNNTFNFKFNDRYIPVSYSPFSFTKIDINSMEFSNHNLISYGIDTNFTIASFKNHIINVSPHLGMLQDISQLNEIELINHRFKKSFENNNITYLKDENIYSIGSKFSGNSHNVQRIPHIYSHFANVLFDNNLANTNCIGIVYDGESFSKSNEIMGGEILFGNLKNMNIVARWKPLKAPGGEFVNYEPWRITLSAIREINKHEDIKNINLKLINKVKNDKNISYILDAIQAGAIQYNYTSCIRHILSAIGELFDYEEDIYDFEFFENMIDKIIKEKTCVKECYKANLKEENNMITINTYELFEKAYNDALKKTFNQDIAIKVIYGILHSTLDALDKISSKFKCKNVALCGEFFKHRHFLDIFYKELTQNGYNVYTANNIPIDDSSISVGQIIKYLYGKN